jgi:hypothetical protein
MDYSPDGKGVNVSVKFYMAFTQNREEAFRLMQRKHLDNMNQLQYYFSDAFAIRQISET